MKQCPRCNRNYADDGLSYCLEDGAVLVTKYDPDATMINPYPPVAVVPPTVAYQPALATDTIHAPEPPAFVPTPAPPRKSPLLVGLLVLIALGVGLAIGAFIFQRSNSAATVSSPTEPERDTVATDKTTSAPVSSTPTPSPAAVAAASPTPTAGLPATVQDQECVLYNDRGDLNVVNVRNDCDQRNCELDATTKAGEYPDNTAIRVFKGSSVRTANFIWVKIVIVSSGRTVWVASSKIKCT